MYGSNPGLGGGGTVVLGASVLPVTGGNPMLMVLSAAIIAVGAAIVLTSVARAAAKKAHQA